MIERLVFAVTQLLYVVSWLVLFECCFSYYQEYKRTGQLSFRLRVPLYVLVTLFYMLMKMSPLLVAVAPL